MAKLKILQNQPTKVLTDAGLDRLAQKTKEKINQKVQIVTDTPTTNSLPEGCVAIRVSP